MKKQLLSILFVLMLVTPSFSQNFPSSFRIFEHKSFMNAEKSFPITGAWNPDKIDNYNIMCVFCEKYYSDKNYIFICNERQCDSWINSLTAMKELFLRNDQIAKENNVTTDIRKDVSEKFSFAGLYGTGMDSSPIVKEYRERGDKYTIVVVYVYEEGKSSMELRVGDYTLGKSRLAWTFNNVQDFDNIINALRWSDFMETFNNEVKKYKDQQEAAKAAAAKKKADEDLFK